MTKQPQAIRLLRDVVPAAGERLQGEVPAVEQDAVPAEADALEAALELENRLSSMYLLHEGLWGWIKCRIRARRLRKSLAAHRGKAAAGGNAKLRDAAQ